MPIKNINKETGDIGELIAGGTLYADLAIGDIVSSGRMWDNPAPGFLFCGGQAISRTTYADLFAAIGTSFGEGDGSTTFNVPDLRGEFIRGAGTNQHAGQGNGGAPGYHQDATIVPYTYSNNGANNVNFAGDGTTQNFDSTPTETGNYQTINSDTHGTGSTYNFGTVRPTNTSVNFFIKAEQITVPADFVSAMDEIYGVLIPSNASASNKLVAKSDAVIRYDYSITGTTDAIADTKALVNHILTLGVGTYAGEFKRSGITFGSYRLTYLIDGIYSKSVSGLITYSIGSNTDATYQVSYVEDIEHGTPPEWKIDKLAVNAEGLSYKTNSGATVDFLQVMEQQPLSKVSFIRIITTNGTNTPDGNADVDFYVWVMKLESTGFIRAVAYNIRNHTIYTISNVSGVWGSWQPLTPVNAITAGSIAPVMSGTIYNQLVQKAQTVIDDIVSQSAGAYSHLVRRGNIVQCIVRFNTEAPFDWTQNTKIGTIPQGYRPAVFQPCPTMNFQSAGTTFTFVSIDTNGDIVCIPLSGDRLDLYINLTWYTEDA